MTGQFLNDIFKDEADLFLIDQRKAEKEGLLEEDSGNKCKKVSIDGKSSRTMVSFMEEVYNKFLFPSFFGRNWSAFVDSYKETLWEDEDNFERYLLVFKNADELLLDASEEDVSALLESLEDIVEALADPESIMPMKIIFCQNGSTTSRVGKSILKEGRNSKQI